MQSVWLAPTPALAIRRYTVQSVDHTFELGQVRARIVVAFDLKPRAFAVMMIRNIREVRLWHRCIPARS